MQAKLLEGKPIAEKIKEQLKEEIESLKIKFKTIPTLATLQVGENPQATLQKLVDQYVELSGQIVKNALGSIFAKYPNLDLDNK